MKIKAILYTIGSQNAELLSTECTAKDQNVHTVAV